MRHKVLIIDDSSSIQQLVTAALKYEPIELRTASDGPDGIVVSASFAPDLILLDVDMPGLDGFEVCRQLKEDRATRDIPVLFLTGVCAVQQKVRGLACGAVDYITKPFHPAELRARVGSALRSKHRRDLMASRSMTDDLTTLWNRTYFDYRFAVAAAEAKRHGRPLSCIVLDIDRLASINARLGEAAGDEVLRAVGQRILDACRTEDTASRLAGGTFAVLSPSTTRSQAVRFAQRLQQRIGPRPVFHGDSMINVKCSVGVASLPVSDAAELMSEAKRALAEAKRSGGNRIVSTLPEPQAMAA